MSPSALNRFLACEYRTYLDMLERRGELGAKRKPPQLQLLLQRGEAFEDGVLKRMRAEKLRVISLADAKGTLNERGARTLSAMREGYDVIHQGCFVSDGWVGYPDFLVRIEAPSDLGAWSYEVHDAKLGGHARPAYIFQLLFYTDELERLQGRRPERMHLILGNDDRPSFEPADFEAYAAHVRAAFLARQKELEDGAPPAYPYPVPECDFCPWWHVCRDKRREEDHISLVANLQRRQGLRIEAQEVHDIPSLASLDDSVSIPRLSKDTLAKLRAQADLQLRSRGRDVPLYVLLEPDHGRGLTRIPRPSPADVYFDFEGDPHWGEGGLEYLFGTVCQNEKGEAQYWPLWAESRAEEKAALETWVDWLMHRLSAYPDLHVYHFNAYEPTALKRLVARHATRELELDELLRRKVFVDLYGVTRQAVRVGVESYGLKGIEALYGFRRNPELGSALGSLGRWQRYLEGGDRSLLDEIALYNRDDCHSTQALCSWLWARRRDAEAKFQLILDELEPPPPTPPSPRQLRLQKRTEALRGTLLTGLPDDESGDTPEQRARRLMFALTGYDTREARPAWWAYFDRRSKTAEELADEDPEAIGLLKELDREDVGSSWQWTLSYPPQDHKIEPGGADDPIAQTGVNVIAVDQAERTVVVRRAKQRGSNPPRAIAPGGPYSTDAQIDALFDLADDIASRGLDQPGVGRDLLLRRTPRFKPGTPPLQPGSVDLDRLCSQVIGLNESALFVQGPPGSGKTWTGARIALALIDAGLRVGVMATAHKAIDNLLAAIDEAADETSFRFRGWRKPPSEGEGYSSDRIHCKAAPDESEGAVMLHAGTAWWWAHPDAARSVNVLIVDEAGQVSLADAMAVAQGAKSLVLLGDPQQLAHVSQGTHPIGAGASVLEHLLDGTDTVADDRGVLLNVSWRMHPDLCDFVSRTMYDGRLTAEKRCANQRIDSPGLSGTGLRMLAVEHVDNRTRSTEEADVIASQVRSLLNGGTFTDRDGEIRLVTLEDILIVAPYNAQVRTLLSRLPAGARVGTVDKFQGQEAPVVFFSMATSTDEDVSRGISFLFSRNRLNVAISRAQALSVVVCSPKLLRARCSNVDDMRLVNMLCLAAEEAGLEVRGGDYRRDGLS
ncbi:MAG: TM0106 family RecB-like putative nuclease [Solirubrobacteraceae bacterium]